MLWLRSSVSKAVEVGGRNNLTRTVRNYADSVGQVVAERAKILQDRMITRNFKSFKHTIKRLEETAVTCRGHERIQLLRRWLVALKQIERASGANIVSLENFLDESQVSDEFNSSPRKANRMRVNISLAAALARLHNTREELEQLDVASNQIVSHFKTKFQEDELSRSVASCNIEADVVHTWSNFLEDTWVLRYADQEELGPFFSSIRKLVDDLRNLNNRPDTNSISDDEISNQRTHREEDYLKTGAQIVTTFGIVDNMQEQFYAHHGNVPWKDDSRIKELFNAVAQIRSEFDAIERPTLQIETPAIGDITMKSQEIPTSKHNIETESPETSAPASADQSLNPAAELAKLESEFGTVCRDYTADETGGWEFDELGQELTSGSPTTNK